MQIYTIAYSIFLRSCFLYKKVAAKSSKVSGKNKVRWEFIKERRLGWKKEKEIKIETPYHPQEAPLA